MPVQLRCTHYTKRTNWQFSSFQSSSVYLCRFVSALRPASRCRAGNMRQITVSVFILNEITKKERKVNNERAKAAKFPFGARKVNKRGTLFVL